MSVTDPGGLRESQADAFRRAMGRDPIAGAGAPERVTVTSVRIPLRALVLLWFQLAIAAIPLAVVLGLIYVALVRWI